jgi:hypothetical protein
MSLMADFAAFIEEHRDCGELNNEQHGDVIEVSCSCGAKIVRKLQDDEADG